MSKRQVVDELHRAARKNFPRRKTIVKHLNDLWQADLADFGAYAKQNRGNKYILLVIDCFSKFIRARPLKSKAGERVADALTSILKESGTSPPKHLQTDQGTEFYNKFVKRVLEKYSINHYSTYSVTKAAIAERAIRTIKNVLYKEFSNRGTYKWIDILDKVVRDYNNRKHSTIRMKPIAVKRNTKLDVFDHVKMMGKHRYELGDVVRISKFKTIFEKGYTPAWSTELFKIIAVQPTTPVTYKIQDMQGRPIEGSFYDQELLKTRFPDIYLVEKILRRKGNKLYVKWLGLDERSWINKNDLV
jgi:hypothetical protein